MSDMSAARPRSRVLRLIFDVHPVTWICIAVICGFIACAILADVISPHDFTAINLRGRNVPPLSFGGTADHVFGTDEIGRDILSRVLHGLRTSLMLTVVAATISLILGTSLGLLAGFFPGWIDNTIRVGIDFQASMPFILIALAILASAGNSLVFFVALLGIFGWERYARFVRGLVTPELSKGYVAALRRNGASGWRIAIHHVMPNVLPIIIVNLTVVLPEILLLESGLSFLGIGIQPPNISLGSLVGNGRNAMMTEWWISTIPGIVIFVLALAISLLGDATRDQLDPTLK